MSIGELLVSFFDQLWELVPVRLVRDWEQGILVVGGRIQRKLTSRNGYRRTGWHFFRPFLEEVVVEQTTQEVAETTPQTLTTADGHTVSVALGVSFRITDLEKLWTTLHDPKQEVLTAVRLSAGGLVRASDFDELSSGLHTMVQGDLQGRFDDWGITLRTVELTTFAECQTVRLIQ